MEAVTYALAAKAKQIAESKKQYYIEPESTKPDASLLQDGDEWLNTDTGKVMVVYGGIWIEDPAGGTGLKDVYAKSEVGLLADLTTTEKGTHVGAINELDVDVGDKTTLTTTSKTSLVSAVNELDGEIGGLSGLTTTEKGTIVGAVNEVNAIAQFAGYKNKIINGRFWHDQEGNMGAQVATGDSVYYADQWYSTNNSGTGAWTPSQISGGGARLTIDTAITDITAGKYFLGHATKLEGFNVHHLNNGYVTLSFPFKAKVNGTYSVALVSGDGSRTIVSDFAYTGSEAAQLITKTFQLEAATVDAFDNTTGIYLYVGAINAGTVATATTDAWVAGGYICSTSATNWVGTAGNYIEVDEVQLEPGSGATEHERIPYDIELLRCMRYYLEIPEFETMYIGDCTTAFTYYISIRFGIDMRAVPTLSVLSSSTGGFQTPTLGNASQTGFRVIGVCNLTGSSKFFRAGVAANARL